MRPGHVVILLMTVTSSLAAVQEAEPARCRDSSRFGKSLQHVEPPPSCLSDPDDLAVTWCDTPGKDYPWQEIRAHLRRSSADVSRRAGRLDPEDVERLLNKYSLTDNRIADNRRRRSADVTAARDITGTRDVIAQPFVREAGRVTSRGSVGTATEATNFELQNQPQDGNSSGSGVKAENFELQKQPQDGNSSDNDSDVNAAIFELNEIPQDDINGSSKAKRINDKNLSEEDELVLLLTYFTDPNNIVFTESVLEGLLLLRDTSGGDAEKETLDDGSEFHQTLHGQATGDDSDWDVVEGGEEGHRLAGVNATSDEVAVPEMVGKKNETRYQWQQFGDKLPESINDDDDSLQQENPDAISQEPASSTSASFAPPSSTPSPPSTLSAPSPSNSSAADPPPLPSFVPIDSLFPDVHSRRPSPSRPGGNIQAESPSEGASPGTRTGAQVLQQIQTGDDVLEEFTGSQVAGSHSSSASSGSTGGAPQWTWVDDYNDNGDYNDSNGGVEGGVGGGGGGESANHDASWPSGSSSVWGDDPFPAEVQYYRPTRPPPVSRPGAVDAYEWVDSATPEWRPVAPPLQAEALIRHPSEDSAQDLERLTIKGEKKPSGAEEIFVEEDRVVVNLEDRPKTTPEPVTVSSFAAELELLEETVYTDSVLQNAEDAETLTTVAMTTTEAPETTPATTPDPYVMPACETSVEVRSPFYAMNTQNVWKMLINIPPFETYIHMEHCVAEHSRGMCADGCRCTQRRSVRTMPVYVRDADGCDRIYMDKFLFPSHCDCMCLPKHHVLFNLTRPPPTTPATAAATSINGGDGSLSSPPSVKDGAGVAVPVVSETATSIALAEKLKLPTQPRPIGGASAEALQAAGLAARVVTAAPTLAPSSRRAPGSSQRTPPPRRPVVPADSLVRSHRNRNRGPAFSSAARQKTSPVRQRTSTRDGVTRRNGRAYATPHDGGEELPPPLPRR